MKCDKYIGCDLHQATTVVTVLDAEGKVAIVATEAAAMIRFLKSLSGSAAYNVRGNNTGAMDV